MSKEVTIKRSLTEDKVLRKLDIPDFRHMTKDKVVSFVSMLPQMDPEVAKRALEQFPAFAETSLAIVNCLRENLGDIVDSNAANAAEFNARCQEALNALETLLLRDDLSDAGREQAINGIMGVLELMREFDRENKAFLKGLLQDILAVSLIIVICLTIPLGLKLNTSDDE